MKAYQKILEAIINYGTDKSSRVGDTRSFFGVGFSASDIGRHFPLMTTKKMNFEAIKAEFLWIISGHRSINWLKQHTKIWNEFADEENNVDSPYGNLLRYTPYSLENQFLYIETELIKNPNSRRAVMSSWFPSNAYHSSLPPCHTTYIFNAQPNVLGGHSLNLHVTQRSGDMALGVPFDIAIWSLVLMWMAKKVKMSPDTISFSIIDAHVYVNHIEQVKIWIERPELRLPQVRFLDEIVPWELDKGMENIVLEHYVSHPAIKFPLNFLETNNDSK